MGGQNPGLREKIHLGFNAGCVTSLSDVVGLEGNTGKVLTGCSAHSRASHSLAALLRPSPQERVAV